MSLGRRGKAEAVEARRSKQEVGTVQRRGPL